MRLDENQRKIYNMFRSIFPSCRIKRATRVYDKLDNEHRAYWFYFKIKCGDNGIYDDYDKSIKELNKRLKPYKIKDACDEPYGKLGDDDLYGDGWGVGFQISKKRFKEHEKLGV